MIAITPAPWRAMRTPPKSYEDHGWRALATVWGGWIIAVPKDLLPRLKTDAEGNAKVLALAPELFDAAHRLTHAKSSGAYQRAFYDLLRLVEES